MRKLGTLAGDIPNAERKSGRIRCDLGGISIWFRNNTSGQRNVLTSNIGGYVDFVLLYPESRLGVSEAL